MKKILSVFVLLVAAMSFSGVAIADDGVKAKFYDFGEMLIDGEIKKPTALYTDARQKVRFDRLLSLKKSFLPALIESSKDKVFK